MASRRESWAWAAPAEAMARAVAQATVDSRAYWIVLSMAISPGMDGGDGCTRIIATPVAMPYAATEGEGAYCAPARRPHLADAPTGWRKMMRSTPMLMLAALAALTLSLNDAAEARRMGGGGNFGAQRSVT